MFLTNCYERRQGQIGGIHDFNEKGILLAK